MVPARFTERAKLLINYANEEAIRLNHSQIDTEHLLLGLVREGQGIAANVLQELGVGLESLEAEVKKMIKESQVFPDIRRPLMFTRAANQVLQYSIDEAKRLEYDHVGTEHILLGLIREEHGVAARALANLGVTLEKISRVLKPMGKSPSRKINVITPIVIAHRGNSGPAPACTMAAIREAVDLSADMIELDVRESRDGIPVIIHNNTVDETTDGKGTVSSLSLAELKELDAGSWKSRRYTGERIPTLMEVLGFAKDKVRLSLDLKEENIISAMIKAVQEADMVDDVVICGCHEPRAQRIWEIDDRLTILMNTDSQLDKLAKNADKSDFIREYIRRACKGKLAALNVSFKYVTQELVRQAHLRALPVWTWTVDDGEDMKRLVQMGVDAIYTNWPEKLLEILGRR